MPAYLHIGKGIIQPTGRIVLEDGTIVEVVCRREALAKIRQLADEGKMDWAEMKNICIQIHKSPLMHDLHDEVIEEVHRLSRNIRELTVKAQIQKAAQCN